MSGKTCDRCGAAVAVSDAFCASCGIAMGTPSQDAAHAALPPDGMVARRRLGGTVELVPAAPALKYASPNGNGTAALAGGVRGAGVIASPAAAVTPVRRRRRRRRTRRWYRRPLVVMPLALLIVVGLAGGLVFHRLGSTLATVRSVSTPPPQVEVSIDEDDFVAAGGDPDAGPLPSIQVDTAPAVAAVAAAGRAPDGGGGGAFGGVRSVASDVADLGRGAAVAAGVRNSAAPALTILVMGVDAGPGQAIDIGVRPDVLMVVRLDPVARECRVLSIPRDTRTELPGYGETKVNHALMVGGIPYQLMVVENLLDITIDRYALIDFTGFKELVDAVGGVTVTVPEAVEFGGVPIATGRQELDGTEALAYARYRDPATQGDAGRIKRQWSILKGLGQALSGRDLASEVNQLLPAVEGHLRTDISATEFAEIARAYGGRCTVETVQPAMLDGTRVRFEDPIFGQPLYYNVVDEAKIEERVAALMGR